MSRARDTLAMLRSAQASWRDSQKRQDLRIPLTAPFPEIAYREVADSFEVHVGRPLASILDIGANFGQCSSYLSARNSIPAEQVVCVEAHPQLVEEIRRRHRFEVLHGAVGLTEEERTFFARDFEPERVRLRDVLQARVAANNRPGMSSLLVHQQDANDDVAAVRVPGILLEKYLTQSGRRFDFAKVDVEGAALEALKSFGERIDRIGSIHIEAETRTIWEGQSLWTEVNAHLEQSGFEMVLFRLDRHFLQCESFWIRQDWIRSFLDVSES